MAKAASSIESRPRLRSTRRLRDVVERRLRAVPTLDPTRVFLPDDESTARLPRPRHPQENAFTFWLGARLTAAGYDVWFDLKRLKGGETHWDDIEDALRNDSAAYLLILSTASINRVKRGFHDELGIGVQVLPRG